MRSNSLFYWFFIKVDSDHLMDIGSICWRIDDVSEEDVVLICLIAKHIGVFEFPAVAI